MTPSFVGITVGLGLCALILIILAWDAYLYTDKIERNSITQVCIDQSKKYPIIAWVIGFFMGFLSAHFYG